MFAMAITLILLAVISSAIARATSVNARETRKADALVSAQAALSVMSREIGNSGFSPQLHCKMLSKLKFDVFSQRKRSVR